MKKRFLSALLSLVLALTLLPAPVSAASKSISAIAAPKLTLDESKTPVLTSGLSDTAHCAVESIVYDTTGPVADYTWFSATVTYAAKDGYTFTSDLKARFGSKCASELVSSSDSQAVVTYYAWSRLDDHSSVTQEMKDYYKAHESDTANGRTPVATGKKFDPVAAQHPDVTGYHTARVYKYPAVVRNAVVGDLPETVKIYDLHAEQLISGVTGQWYLVSCGNRLGFVPAACVTDVTSGGSSGTSSGSSTGSGSTGSSSSGAWAGAPGVWKISDYTFAGGSGTKEDPYLIATADQLNAVRRGMDKHYMLVADIDLSSWGNWTPLGGNPAYEYNGRDCVRFTGSLNGNGHVISGMTIVDHREQLYNEGDYVHRCYGLFNNVWNSEFTYEAHQDKLYADAAYNNIWDLGIVNYTIDLSYTDIANNVHIDIGALSAFMSNSRVANCYTSGGSIRVQTGGGAPQVYIGGLVSNLGNSAFVDCYNASPITVNTFDGAGVGEKRVQAGGIVNSMTYCWIFRCFNTGDITVPFASDVALDSMACGIVDTQDHGDLPGVYGYTRTGTSYLKDCYNTGNMTGNMAFGLLGYAYVDVFIENCYSVGTLKVDSMAEKGGTDSSSNDIAFTSEGYNSLKGNRTHNGVKVVSGDAWQNSAKLGRKVLKSHPEDVLGLTKPAAATAGGFNDVKASDYYADPILWAVKRGITNGTGAGAFSPALNCTRAQVLTFLWRYAGSPEPSIANPYTDVKASDWFYKPALWAYENGMFSGTTFNGGIDCVRSEAVTYLHKGVGGDALGQLLSAGFADVPASAPYANAVNWAVWAKVTNGVSANRFGPNETCTRGQIVTFLWRTERYNALLDDWWMTQD